MAWGFGNISASTSMKSMAVDEKDKIKDFILVNHYMDGEDYYLFLCFSGKLLYSFLSCNNYLKMID